MAGQPLLSRRTALKCMGLTGVGLGLGHLPRRALAQTSSAKRRPNILFVISDDQSWLHTSMAGDPVVRTPNFDRIAKQGAYCRNAFCCAPSCSPSRAAVLSGQEPFRLGDAVNLRGPIPADVPLYPDLLAQAGYQVGMTGKGWGPGEFNNNGRTVNPAGADFGAELKRTDMVQGFDRFLNQCNADQPFCFWLGSYDPHRTYDPGCGRAAGLDPQRVNVPPFLPDVPQVREDIINYMAEIQRFDDDLGQALAMLEAYGQLDDTLIVVTSDNGMPFPRAKANLYEYGTHMPLAIRWPGHIAPGRTMDDLVSFADFAPTFLDAAGVAIPSTMSGRSLLSTLTSDRPDLAPHRESLITTFERHVTEARAGEVGYPMRALRTADHLYIRNFHPERWPAGDPPQYSDVDINNKRGSLSKDYMLDHSDVPQVAPLFKLAFDKRPPEELYDVNQDPANMHNLAADPQYAALLQMMRAKMQQQLTALQDARADAVIPA